MSKSRPFDVVSSCFLCFCLVAHLQELSNAEQHRILEAI